MVSVLLLNAHAQCQWAARLGEIAMPEARRGGSLRQRSSANVGQPPRAHALGALALDVPVGAVPDPASAHTRGVAREQAYQKPPTARAGAVLGVGRGYAFGTTET